MLHQGPLCLKIYPVVICGAGLELTLAISVQRFTIFLYIEIFIFVKISEVCIYLTVEKKSLSFYNPA